MARIESFLKKNSSCSNQELQEYLISIEDDLLKEETSISKKSLILVGNSSSRLNKKDNSQNVFQVRFFREIEKHKALFSYQTGKFGGCYKDFQKIVFDAVDKEKMKNPSADINSDFYDVFLSGLDGELAHTGNPQFLENPAYIQAWITRLFSQLCKGTFSRRESKKNEFLVHQASSSASSLPVSFSDQLLEPNEQQFFLSKPDEDVMPLPSLENGSQYIDFLLSQVDQGFGSDVISERWYQDNLEQFDFGLFESN